MNYRRILFAGLMLTAFSIRAYAAPLFEESSVLDIELTGPLTELLSDKNSKEKMTFTLRADGAEHSIEVRLRGNSRRGVCSFPPLRLSFKKKASVNTLFENQKHLKLVTHCRESEAAQQVVLKEYMAYRIFNMLTDWSYRVRLVRVTYVDAGPESGTQELQRYGYIIESEDELIERIGATKANRTAITRGSLDAGQAALVFVFHYLIGNTDWSMVKADVSNYCCHNGTLLELESKLILVPYDFDLSGLVSARYARPDPSLRIKRVRQRLYRGYCLPGDELPRALRTIMDEQSNILTLPFETPGVVEKEMGVASGYLETFFKNVKDIEKTAKKFESRCL